MGNKGKLKETVVRFLERQKDGYLYTYRLLVSESQGFSSFKIPLYSVNVTMSGPDMEPSTATAKEMFSDAAAAIDFFEKTASNLVTPIDLPYIVEDELRR